MSGLDVGILILSVFGAFLGMQLGVVAAFFDIVAGFAGSWAASRFYPPLAAAATVLPSLAYFVLFAVVAGVFVAAGIVFSHLLEKFFLGLIDKFLGALLGIALCLLFATSVLFPLMLDQSPAVQDMVRRSAFAPYTMRSAQRYLRLAPKALWERLEPLLESEQVRRVRKLLESSR